MAQRLYIEDGDLTGRLPTLTGSDLASSSDRESDVLTPASAWIDGVFPYDSPFTAAPSSPSIIKQGCLEYALGIAHSILGAGEASDRAYKRAKDMLMIDEKTGRARVHIPDVHGTRQRIRVIPIHRSRPAEEDDDTDAENRLWP